MSSVAQELPRVLLAVGAEHQAAWQALFRQEPLDQWETRGADSFAQARFTLQHQTFDLLVLGSDLVEREGSQGLAWLAFQQTTPMLYLGDDQAKLYARVFDMGLYSHLPQALAWAHPPLLHAVMRQNIAAWDAKASQKRNRELLGESRLHVDRLVQMIWRMSPRHDDQWYSQRHMLDRLNEELARCQRHQVPLSVAVGELQPHDDQLVAPLPNWSADAIVRAKRRSDVVGQYGLNGFMLLMVHTPKPGGVTCCERLLEYLEHPAAELTGPRRPVRSYIGLASASAEKLTPQSLLRVAEQNLEAARTRPTSAIVAE